MKTNSMKITINNRKLFFMNSISSPQNMLQILTTDNILFINFVPEALVIPLQSKNP